MVTYYSVLSTLTICMLVFIALAMRGDNDDK